MDRTIYKKNEKIWFISLFIVFILDLLFGVITQSYGLNYNLFLVPLMLLIFPGYFFVISYYGIYRKIFILNKSTFFVFGPLGYLLFLEVSRDDDNKNLEEERLAKKIGIISLIPGLITFGFFVFIIYKNVF
jgi:hypothetical protein